jgi:hypothetical protein
MLLLHDSQFLHCFMLGNSTLSSGHRIEPSPQASDGFAILKNLPWAASHLALIASRHSLEFLTLICSFEYDSRKSSMAQVIAPSPGSTPSNRAMPVTD